MSNRTTTTGTPTFTRTDNDFTVATVGGEFNFAVWNARGVQVTGFMTKAEAEAKAAEMNAA